MITLRKIRASSPKISTMVTRPTMNRAVSEDSWESSDWAAGAGDAGPSSVSATSGSRSSRSFFASSIAATSNAFLPCWTVTKMAWTSPFSDAGRGRGGAEALELLGVELSAMPLTAAWSSSVSCSPSSRSKTTIAPISPRSGKASCWRVSAFTDS